MNVRLRPATCADIERTFVWATDEDTRAASFHSAPIAPSEHDAWFRRSLASVDRLLFIGEVDGTPVDGTPVGIIRLDLGAGDRAEIALTVAPEWRGRGLAAALLRAGIERAAEIGVDGLVARIRPQNVRSIRCFVRAGFRAAGGEQVAGQAALRYELSLCPER